MTTLIIHAPAGQSRLGKRSFERTLRTRVGRGYAIWKRLREKCYKGCAVVVLSKDEERRAEGRLAKLVPTVKTDSGIQRYDVHMTDLREVRYRDEAVNRNGVNVLDSDPRIRKAELSTHRDCQRKE